MAWSAGPQCQSRRRGYAPHGRALSCRGASVGCSGLPPANFLQVTPPIRPGPSALRTAVGGEQHLSPLLYSTRASCTWSCEVSGERLNYSCCWTGNPKKLQRRLCLQPLHLAGCRPALPSSWQLQLREVPHQICPEPGPWRGRGATTVVKVCLKGSLPRRLLRSTDRLLQSRPGGSIETGTSVPVPCSTPHRALPTLTPNQVHLATLLRTELFTRDDQAGPLTVLMPADLDHLSPQLPVPSPVCLGSSANACTSPKLLVALHTAPVMVATAFEIMPSPSAKLKASRRLPKRLRLSGEQPTGDMAVSRTEAADRHARGESNTKCQHSCHQGKRRSEDAAASNARWQTASWEWQDASWDWREGWRCADWGNEWQALTSSGSGDAWAAMPKPPPPPPPRWRPKLEDSGAKSGPPEAVATAAKSRPPSWQEQSIAATAVPDDGRHRMARGPKEQPPGQSGLLPRMGRKCWQPRSPGQSQSSQG